jgi:hypothetical protein
MKYLSLSAALLTLSLTTQARAIGNLADVSLIDRDSGAVLPMHYHRGEFWVAGSPGARYAIEIRNRLGERVLAVTSVDGVNVVSGATAGWDQTGYVFGGAQSYQITGWRKSDADVAAFAFTPSPNSYAERTGRPANVGVIGVALFRERPIQVPSVGMLGGTRHSESPTDNAARAASAPPVPASVQPPESLARDFSNGASLNTPLAAPKLGTAHGQRESSFVTRTEFERLQSEPNEVIRIRYDSMENLVAMGVVRRGNTVPRMPNAFPGMPERSYVPDPPG